MRTTGTSNDFMISLKQPLMLVNQQNFFRVIVDKAIIPHTIKQINSKNNTLSLTWQRGLVTINTSITLSEGNYNINTLLSELASQIITKIVTMTSITPNLSFTYNKTTGKCTFTMIGNDFTSTTLTLRFGDNIPLGKFFGFISNAVISYDNNNVSTSAVGTQNVNVNQINYLLIRSSTLIQRECYENVVERDVYSDILAKVLVNVTPGSYILYDGNSNLACDVANKVIDQINIYLSDNLSYELSLYGLEWNLVLIIQEIGTHKSDQLLSMELPSENIQQNREQLMSQLDEIKRQLNAIDQQEKSQENK